LFILGNNNVLQTIAVRHKIRAYVVALNMFEKAHRTAVHESRLYLQRQSTRVYFLLLSLALFILVVYTSLIYQQNDDTINISSFENFQQLQDKYGPTTVDCPCTKISFNRSTFHQVEPVFHQICSSDFINTSWLDTLFTSYVNQEVSKFHTYTFGGTAFAHFQSLSIMCDLTKQAVIDARDLFLATQVVSAFMLAYDLFEGQTTAALTSFKSTLPNSFVLTLQMLLGMAQGNGFVSGYSTNWGLFLPNMTSDATIYTQARIYDGCNCATSASCIQSSKPYVPGFVVGCLPLQSFLRSTFECLYNQSCVDIISSYVNASVIPRALSNTSRFASNLLTNDIVQEMFIESWSLNVSYENFFQQCKPISCSYTLIGRYNVLYVVTTIVGLYGGLTVLLKLVVPVAVHRIHKLVRRQRHTNIQVAPEGEHY
jgi:hypothetical protein